VMFICGILVHIVIYLSLASLFISIILNNNVYNL